MRLLATWSIIFVLVMASCATKTVYVPVESKEKNKEYVDRWMRDSVYLRDSIYIEHKGDTVWLQKYRTLYKEKLVRDSIFITDSIRVQVPYPVVELKEVNRLRNWQLVLMCLGGILIGIGGYRLTRWFRLF